MPEMDGPELAEHLLALQPRLKCLFMSGYTADVIAPHGVIAGDVSFIEKPFAARGLSSKVRQMLEQS